MSPHISHLCSKTNPLQNLSANHHHVAVHDSEPTFGLGSARCISGLCSCGHAEWYVCSRVGYRGRTAGLRRCHSHLNLNMVSGWTSPWEHRLHWVSDPHWGQPGPVHKVAVSVTRWWEHTLKTSWGQCLEVSLLPKSCQSMSQGQPTFKGQRNRAHCFTGDENNFLPFLIHHEYKNLEFSHHSETFSPKQLKRIQIFIRNKNELWIFPFQRQYTHRYWAWHGLICSDNHS